jgi:hypothetical protein
VLCCSPSPLFADRPPRRPRDSNRLPLLLLLLLLRLLLLLLLLLLVVLVSLR